MGDAPQDGAERGGIAGGPRGELFRLLADAMPVLVWTAGPDGEPDYLNRRWAEYTGRELEGPLGGALGELVHPDDIAQCTEAWNRDIRAGEPWEAQYRLRRADGTYRWHLGRAVPLRDERGRLIGWIGTSTDIDDQKRTEARLDALVRSAPVGIGLLDSELRYLEVNDVLAELNGLPREAHLGRKFPEILPALATFAVPLLRRVLETGQPLLGSEVTVESPAQPGVTRHWLVNYYPIFLGRDAIGIAGVIIEISERKRAEQALDLLARSGAVLSASLDPDETLAHLASFMVPEMAEGCAVQLVDEGGQLRSVAITHSDPAQQALMRELQARFPFSPDAPHGPPRVLRTGAPELFPRVPEEVRDALSTDPEQRRLLFAIDIRSAIVVPMATQGRTIGAITLISTNRSYTPADLRLAEELARRAASAVENARLFDLMRRERRRAEEADRAKDEFLAVVSHELRTPLTAILGWTRMLRTGAVREGGRERALAAIERNAEAQARIVEDLLDVSRIITGKLKLRPARVALAPILRAASDAIRPAATAKGVALEVAVVDEAASVLGDADRLQQVAWNLLSNAVKFTPTGGRVRAALRQEDQRVELDVEDTGRGIAPDFIDHVFERFRQADSGTTRALGGLGLGLAIVRHLVELHGGTVEASSAGLGRGATFRVRLPVPPADADAAAAPPRASPSAPPAPPRERGPRLAGLKVLAVDDDEDTRDLLAEALGQAGARVTLASSAAEALRLVPELLPDVIVADIAMPGEDGYSLIAQVRALRPADGGRTPAVALTALARAEDRAHALRAGYDRHLPKPVDFNVLADTIATLAHRRAR